MPEKKQREKLVKELQNAGAPHELIENAQGGFYDMTGASPIQLPRHRLIHDCLARGLTALAYRIIDHDIYLPGEER